MVVLSVVVVWGDNVGGSSFAVCDTGGRGIGGGVYGGGMVVVFNGSGSNVDVGSGSSRVVAAAGFSL